MTETPTQLAANAAVSFDLEAAKDKPEVLLYGRFERGHPEDRRWVIGQWFDAWSDDPAEGFWTAHALRFLPEAWSPLPEMKDQAA